MSIAELFFRGIRTTTPAANRSLLAMERFVHRSRHGQILDVDEFQVAKALLNGQLEALGHSVDSRHLFELCLAFGHQSTAAAMLSHGVPGCVVTVVPGVRKHSPVPVPTDRHPPLGPSSKSYTKTRYPSYGPQEKAICMADQWERGDAAVAAAEKAADMPIPRMLLDALRSSTPLPCVIADNVMARLLDIAVLLKDRDLASRLVTRCTYLPHRWLNLGDFISACLYNVGRIGVEIDVHQQALLLTALAADMHVGQLCFRGFSLREALALCSDEELWCEIKDLMPTPAPDAPHVRDNDRILFFLQGSPESGFKLSLDQLLLVKRRGLLLDTFQVQINEQCTRQTGQFPCRNSLNGSLTLLDVAILLGQEDCAAFCGLEDISTSEWTGRLTTEESPFLCSHCDATSRISRLRFTEFKWCKSLASLSQRKHAAGVALRAALQLSHKHAVSCAGLGLLQAMRSAAGSRRVSPVLVKLVLAFATELPRLSQVLDCHDTELLPRPWWE